MPAPIRVSNSSLLLQGGQNSSREAVEPDPDYSSLQSVNPDAPRLAEDSGFSAEMRSVDEAIHPRPPFASIWTPPTTTVPRKRSRSDDDQAPPSKRTRSSMTLEVVEGRQSHDEPWSPLSSRRQLRITAPSVEGSVARVCPRKRTHTPERSAAGSEEALLSTTTADDISQALTSEVKTCKSWEGIQRTIKLGLLKLFKPDALKGLDICTPQSSPLTLKRNKRPSVSCKTCGKVFKRQSELKLVFPFSFYDSFVSSLTTQPISFFRYLLTPSQI